MKQTINRRWSSILNPLSVVLVHGRLVGYIVADYWYVASCSTVGLALKIDLDHPSRSGVHPSKWKLGHVRSGQLRSSFFFSCIWRQMNVDRLVHLATPSVRYALLSVHCMKVAGVGSQPFCFVFSRWTPHKRLFNIRGHSRVNLSCLSLELHLYLPSCLTQLLHCRLRWHSRLYYALFFFSNHQHSSSLKKEVRVDPFNFCNWRTGSTSSLRPWLCIGWYYRNSSM